MADRFANRKTTLDSPARDAFSITPNDGTDLASTTRALYIGGAGDISLITAEGTTLTFVGLSASFILPVRAVRVRSTGTTATNIIGLE